jgi:peptidoglycan lytic transglycosylase
LLVIAARPHVAPHFRLLCLVALALSAALLVSGCGNRRVVARPPVSAAPAPDVPAVVALPSGSDAATEHPGQVFQEGEASWYGAPFHGRRASNGEIYDMNKMTAAHRTLPFGTIVRVINTTNGKSATVRITDRGPFVGNRIIDLSFAAAKEIESIGPGVVRVQLEILSAIDPNAGYFCVQIGAFRDRTNAERMKTRLSAEYSPIHIVEFPTDGGAFYRVRVGKVSGEQAAQALGEQLRGREGVSPLIFRVDDVGSEGTNQ